MVTPQRGALPADLALVLAAEPDPGAVALRLEAIAGQVLAARVSVVLDRGAPACPTRASCGPHTICEPLTWADVSSGALEAVREDTQSCFDEEDAEHARLLAAHGALAIAQATERDQHASTALQLARQQALASAALPFVALADDDGHPSFVNSRAGEAGIEIGEGGLWAVLARGRDVQTEQVRRVVSDDGSWSGDIELGGSQPSRIAHVVIFALRDPSTGEGLGTGWIAEEVTALKQTEEDLREASARLERFRSLVEASGDFIAIAALDGSVVYVNPAGRRLVGFPPDIDVTTTTIVDYLTPEGIAASLEIEQPAVQSEGHWEGESTLLHRPDGRAVPVAIASFLMYDGTGEPFALATVQRDISERKANEDALRALAEQRQALLERLVRAQAEERAEIANDVHDDPVQALAAVDLRLGLLARKLGDQAPQLLPALVPVQESVTGATRRLRGLIFNLQPPDFDHGLTFALDQAAHDIFDGSSTLWTVRAEHEPVAPDATRAVAYRVAREAMTNARKHARANTVAVSVRERDGGLEVSVTDDGVGISEGPFASSPGHRGLGSMRDRAEIAGGRWDLTESPTGGVEVLCWLPLSSPDPIGPGSAPR